MPEEGLRIPADAAGAETLEIMSAAPRYNAWQFDVIAPFLGRRVLEVGSGIGNMSAHILAGDRDRVVLTDTDPWYREHLGARFGRDGRVHVDSLTLPDPGAAPRFAHERLDTIVALNVVEHIEDDIGALRTMASIVGEGGTVVILVPAMRALYGSLDRELGHVRRYTRVSLSAAYRAAGIRLHRLFWFNRVGMLGWWLNARVRRAVRIPLRQLKIFDAIVPVIRLERYLPLPFGQSLVAVGYASA